MPTYGEYQEIFGRAAGSTRAKAVNLSTASIAGVWAISELVNSHSGIFNTFIGKFKLALFLLFLTIALDYFHSFTSSIFYRITIYRFRRDHEGLSSAELKQQEIDIPSYIEVTLWSFYFLEAFSLSVGAIDVLAIILRTKFK